MNYEPGKPAPELPHSPSEASIPSTLHSIDSELKAVFAEAPCSPQNDQETMPSHIGCFIPKRQLGCGGFAVVYLAYDPRLKRDVAVKVPRTNFLHRQELLMRFEREAKAVATLKHVNIQPILEAGRAEGVPYLVSPVCYGCDLAKWLASHRERSVPPAVIVRWMEQLADAVHHAHQRGFIHRDIKPSNILLEPDEEKADDVSRFVPKLTDFGLAKALQQENEEALTQSGDMLGTLEYMAPEQVSGDQSDVGIATDIHALGVILYELCTSRRLFRGLNRGETLLNVLHATPSFASTGTPFPRDLQAICQRCLAKKPGERYASAAELADDLRRFQRGKPTRARPISRRERTIRWVRRHPWATAAVASLCFLLLTLAVTVFRYEGNLHEAFVREKGLRKTAEENADLLAETLYAATLRESTELIESGRLEAAIDKIASLVPKPNEPDRREFAWKLLHKRVWDQPVVLLANSSRTVSEILLFHDEKFLATFSKDQVARVWNLATGEHRTVNEEDELFISQGTSQYTSMWPFLSIRHQFCLWDFSHTGESLKRVPLSVSDQPLTNGVNIALSQNGRFGVIGYKDYGLLLIDLIESTKRVLLPAEFRQNKIGLTTLMFSPDSQFLVAMTANSDGKDAVHRLFCWDVLKAELIGEVVPGPLKALPRFAFSNEGQSLFVGFDGEDICEIALPTLVVKRELVKKLSGRPPNAHLASGRPPLPIYYRPRSWLYGRVTGEVVKLDLESGDEVIVTRHREPPIEILTTADDWMLSWDNNELHKTDLKGHAPQEKYTIPPMLVKGLGHDFLTHGQFQSNTNSFLFGGLDGRIAVWKLAPPSAPFDMVHGAFGAWSVALTPDGRFLVSGGDDGDIQIWDAQSRKRVSSLKGHHALVNGLDISTNGTLLASGSYDMTVRLWSLPSGKPVRQLEGHDKPILCVAISPDGRFVAAGAKRGRLMIWETESGKVVFDKAAHTDHIHGLVFSVDGKKLFSCSEDQKIHEWDWATGKPIRTFIDRDEVWKISLRDTKLYAAGRGREISQWSLENGRLEKRWFDPQTPLRALCVSPDGRTVVTAGEDGPIRLWLATTGDELTRLETGKHKVLSLSMSRDGNKLAAVCHDGHILLWEVSP